MIIFMSLVVLTFSSTVYASNDRLSPRDINGGIKLLKKADFDLWGYQDNRAVKIASFRTMKKLADSHLQTTYVLSDRRGGPDRQVTTLTGNQTAARGLGEWIWKKICKAADLWDECSEFFGW